MPYTPNFWLYNQQNARLLQLGDLVIMNREEAVWSQSHMCLHVQTLPEMLEEHGVQVIPLEPRVPLLLVDVWSDGIHLGTVLQRMVFGHLLEEVFHCRIPWVPNPLVVHVCPMCARWQRRH